MNACPLAHFKKLVVVTAVSCLAPSLWSCVHQNSGLPLEWSWGSRSRALTGPRLETALTQNYIPTGQVLYNHGQSSWHMVVTPEKKRGTIADFFFLREFTGAAGVESLTASTPEQEHKEQEALVFRRGFSRQMVLAWEDRVRANELLAPAHAYAVIENAKQWGQTYNVVFVGQRPRKLSQTDYLTKFETYVNAVKPVYQVHGVLGYVLFLEQDFSCFMLGFTDKNSYDAFLATPEGKKTFADLDGILQTVMVMGESDYNGQIIYDSYVRIPPA